MKKLTMSLKLIVTKTNNQTLQKLRVENVQ